jgi:Transposase IS66 family
VEAPQPEHLIKSGLPTEAMVASVLVAKYGWHLPLYRQAKMPAAQGLDLDRSTLAFWVGYAAAELMPLYERLKAQSTAGKRLRGHHRLRACIPLRRLRHAPHPSDCPCFMTFETDSNLRPPDISDFHD